MKDKKIMVLGGTSSGKSDFSLSYGEGKGRNKVFLATGVETDTDMAERIKIHKKKRDNSWKTIEEDCNIPEEIIKQDGKCDILLLDSLSFWISQMLLDGMSEGNIIERIDEMIVAINKVDYSTIIVSDEIGMGVIPQNLLARRFAEISGKANQVVAANFDAVYFVVSGIPWKIK